MVRPQGRQHAFCRRGVVGVVKHHRKGRGAGNHLAPAPYHRASQPGLHSRHRHAQHVRRRKGCQCVLYAERPGHRHGEIRHPPAGQPHGEIGSQRICRAPRRKPRQGQPIRRRSDAIPYHPAAVAFQNGGCFPVVGVRHAYLAAAEQHAFPGAVLGIAGMLAGTDVVRRQIGKHTYVKCNAAYPVHLQPQAGNFHHTSVAAVVGHVAQNMLQIAAFGGGVTQCVPLPRPHCAVGANASHPPPSCRQHRCQQVGSGRLALGARDADHRHPPRGITIQPRCHQRQHPASLTRLRLHQRRAAGPGKFKIGKRVLKHQHRRPGRRGRVGKASAVGVLPRQADEYAPGRHRAGVTANGVHLDVAAALYKGAVQIFQQAAKHHRASLAFPPYYAQFCRCNPGLQVCQARLLDFLHPACYNG